MVSQHAYDILLRPRGRGSHLPHHRPTIVECIFPGDHSQTDSKTPCSMDRLKEYISAFINNVCGEHDEMEKNWDMTNLLNFYRNKYNTAKKCCSEVTRPILFFTANL